MVFATLMFTGMQIGVRMIASDQANPLHPIELAFFRNVFGVVALAPVIARMGLGVFRTDRLKLHMIRALCQSVGMMCFFTALTLLPLAQINALSFSAPLFATLMAVIVLRERIRARRMSALLVGFAGVMIVLQPWNEGFDLNALLVIGSSFTWAIAMTMIKSLSRTESAVTITLYAGVFLVPLTGIPMLFVWTEPTLTQLAWLLGIGIVATAGHVAFAQAFKIAEMSAVLPLDFLRLIWASTVGFFLFAETPPFMTLIGGAVIFASACYIGIREAQLGARRAAQATQAGAVAASDAPSVSLDDASERSPRKPAAPR